MTYFSVQASSRMCLAFQLAADLRMFVSSAGQMWVEVGTRLKKNFLALGLKDWSTTGITKNHLLTKNEPWNLFRKSISNGKLKLELEVYRKMRKKKSLGWYVFIRGEERKKDGRGGGGGKKRGERGRNRGGRGKRREKKVLSKRLITERNMEYVLKWTGFILGLDFVCNKSSFWVSAANHCKKTNAHMSQTKICFVFDALSYSSDKWEHLPLCPPFSVVSPSAA